MIFRLLIFQSSRPHLFQQIAFDFVKFVRQIHVNLMGIDQTPGLIPECFLLLAADLLYHHNGRRRIDTFALLEDRYQQFPQDVRAALDFCFFLGFHRIKDDHIFRFIESFIGQTDQICADLAVFFVVDPVDGLIARVCHLFCVF